jgi:NAD(P) transhydrogenase
MTQFEQPIRANYDVVVIGTGPGGEGAAMEFVKEGRTVAAIEKMPRIGGNCTHKGTIPSKALRSAIFRLMEANKHSCFRESGKPLAIKFSDLRKSASQVIDAQVELRRGFYERNDVDIIRGSGKILDRNTVEVQTPNGQFHQLNAEVIVIASGSRPFRPESIEFDHPHIFDSDSILEMDETPKSITVFGAGVIGCEYASMLVNLGVRVNLVNTRDRLLEFLDDEIIDALCYQFRDLGIRIHHGESLDSVDTSSKGVTVKLSSGKQLHTDALLWAIGRQGNTEQLGLENVDISLNERGHIETNEFFQTKNNNIIAVGDVTGVPSLASAAYVQGRYAACCIGGGMCADAMVNDIPTGIYTSPEISSIGKIERELTEELVPYEVGHAKFKNLARAQITGRTTGMLKILFHRETLEILGIHCFGANASEIIHIGQAIMQQPSPNNTLHYFIKTTFNYPTMAEAYRVAALNGYNRVHWQLPNNDLSQILSSNTAVT